VIVSYCGSHRQRNGHFAVKNEYAGRFVTELASFLGVPIVKVAPPRAEDPFVADLTEFLGDIARLLRLPIAASKPKASYGNCLDFEDL
jgi:hypothetical protein